MAATRLSAQQHDTRHRAGTAERAPGFAALNLTDEQWILVEPLIPRPARDRGGRPRVHSHRSLLDGIRYVESTGISWHRLPDRYPPWQTVNAYANAWRRDGTLDRIHAALAGADQDASRTGVV